MSFIDPVLPEEAPGDTAALYQEDLDRLGYIANYTKAASHRPNVMRAWQQLNGAIRENMDPRRYELATFAAALQLRSSYCALAHGWVLENQFFDTDTVAALAADRTQAGVSEADLALMNFAEQVAQDASAVTAADIERLRELGFSDADIFDVASAAAARCFFSKLLDALGTEPDGWYHEGHGDRLKATLTVGRPIAAD